VGKLDKVIAMEQGRKEVHQDGSLTTLMMAASDNVSKFEKAIAALTQKLEQAELNLGSAVSGISIPDHRKDLAEVRSDLVEMANLMSKQVSSVHHAVKGIKIPKMPAIPEQLQTDLSPVLRAISEINIEYPEMPESRHTGEWEFEIERNQFGIKRVIARPI